MPGFGCARWTPLKRWQQPDSSWTMLPTWLGASLARYYPVAPWLLFAGSENCARLAGCCLLLTEPPGFVSAGGEPAARVGREGDILGAWFAELGAVARNQGLGLASWLCLSPHDGEACREPESVALQSINHLLRLCRASSLKPAAPVALPRSALPKS